MKIIYSNPTFSLYSEAEKWFPWNKTVEEIKDYPHLDFYDTDSKTRLQISNRNPFVDKIKKL